MWDGQIHVKNFLGVKPDVLRVSYSLSIGVHYLSFIVSLQNIRLTSKRRRTINWSFRVYIYFSSKGGRVSTLTS